MSLRLSTVRRGLLRAGLVGMAVLVTSGVALPLATAAPGATIVLDPPDVYVGLGAVENYGPRAIASPAAAPAGYDPVEAAWGGSVTITLPAQLADGGGLVATLLLYTPHSSGPTKTYSSDSADPSTSLALTSLGANQVQIDLPPDDGVNGPGAALLVRGFDVVNGVGVQEHDAAPYWLELGTGGPAAVSLTPQLLALGYVPGAAYASLPPSAVLAPGATFDVALPASARLTGLGIADLSTSAFSMWREDSAGNVVGAAVPLGATLSADGRTASFTVPAGTPAGRYHLEAVLGDGSDTVWAQFRALVEISAQNTGLRSDTGWAEDVDGAGSSALVPLGVGMVVLAGAATVAALRMRRRTGSAT